MKLCIENFTTLLMVAVILLGGCNGCKQEGKEALQDKQLPNNVINSEHDHNTTAYTKVPKAPEGDTFFPTIQFPKTPPERPGGHYINPPKNPFEIPDFVKKYPDHFRVDDNGFWHVKLPPEKAQKLEAFDGTNLTKEEYEQQIAEIVGEGLDDLTTAVCLSSLAGIDNKVNELYDKAYAQNPDDLYTGLYHYTGLQIYGKHDEAEAGFRKIVKMYPDSIKALYKLAKFISTEPDSSDAHRHEAIPYFEKLYHEKPFWHAPIYHLGVIYYGLGEYEKSLAYFQASEVFTGPLEGTSFFIHLIREQPSMKQNKE